MTETYDHGLGGPHVGEQWAVFERTVRSLATVEGITEAGYDHLRDVLRSGAWSGLPAHMSGLRELLLADVTEALILHRPGLAEHYRSVDGLPTAPDFPPDTLPG